jgi:hypothetical protein
MSSLMPQEIFKSHTDVFGDVAQEHRRNVSARMVRNRRAATVRVAILQVRAALP